MIFESAPDRLTALLSCSAGTALAFAWAARVLPSEPGSPLALLAALLAVAHGSLLPCAWFARGWFGLALRLLGGLSLLAGALFAGAIAWTSIELVRRFGTLGWGVSTLLGLIGLLLLALTWPFGMWVLGVPRGPRGVA